MMTLPTFKIGTYGGGNGNLFPPYLPQVTKFLGRTPDLTVVFTDDSSKQGFRNDGTWAPGYYKGLVPTVVVRVPLVTSDDESYADLLAGGYDGIIAAVGEAWQAAGFTKPGQLYIDIDHECNGGWFPGGNLNSSVAATQEAQIAIWAKAWSYVAAKWRLACPNAMIGLSLAGGNQQVSWTDLTAATPTAGKLDRTMGLQWIGCDHYGQGLPYGQVNPQLADYQRYAGQGYQFDGFVPGSATQVGWLRWWATQLGVPYAFWEFCPSGDRPDGNGNQIGTGDNPGCFEWVNGILTDVPSGTGPGQLIGVAWWDTDMAGTGGYNGLISDGVSHPKTGAAVKAAWGTPAAPAGPDPNQPHVASLVKAAAWSVQQAIGAYLDLDPRPGTAAADLASLQAQLDACGAVERNLGGA